MANCPKCGGQIKINQVICPHCGYDFPFKGGIGSTQATQKKGIAYTALADFALVIGMMFSGLGALFSLGVGVLHLFNGKYLQGLVQAPLSFLLSLALFVVFQRVADMD